MYELIIKTIYNTIHLTVDDYTTPEIQEILNQPYVLNVDVYKTNQKVKKRCKNEMENNPKNERRH